MYPISSIKSCLRSAIHELNLRGLLISAKWSSEQLVGMTNEGDDEGAADNHDHDVDNNSTPSMKLTKRENDMLLLGVSLLQNGEFHRCAHLMRSQSNSKTGSRLLMHSGALAQSIACYSLYMAGEKVREQSIAERDGSSAADRAGSAKANQARKTGKDNKNGPIANPFHQSSKKNPFLNEVFRELYPIYSAYVQQLDVASDPSDTCHVVMDGYLMFLFGVVVKRLRAQGGGPIELMKKVDSFGSGSTSASYNVTVASTLDLFLEAIKLNPWNW